MQVYAGFDLHANNNFLGVVDEQGKKILKKKLLNEPGTILNACSVSLDETGNNY